MDRATTGAQCLRVVYVVVCFAGGGAAGAVAFGFVGVDAKVVGGPEHIIGPPCAEDGGPPEEGGLLHIWVRRVGVGCMFGFFF